MCKSGTMSTCLCVGGAVLRQLAARPRLQAAPSLYGLIQLLGFQGYHPQDCFESALLIPDPNPAFQVNADPVAEFIDPWLGDKVDSGIGLSYRPASICSLAGRQPYARVDFIPPSQGRDYEFGYRNITRRPQDYFVTSVVDPHWFHCGSESSILGQRGSRV